MKPPANRDQQGRFPKGVSGNPSGRPKTDGWFRELCRKRTRKALKALTDALEDPDQRVAAAKAVLEFAWGKAPAAGFAQPEEVQTSAQWKPEDAKALLKEIRKQRKADEPNPDAEH
jgi:hypothetical protein